jgi:hypothetical protein
MQLAVIEFARHVAGLPDAHSTEFDPETPHPVVALITEWQDRDGRVEQRDASPISAEPCAWAGRSASCWPAAWRARSTAERIVERHRHRYEVNNHFLPRLKQAGCGVGHVGRPKDDLCEMIELPDHPWFVGCQFHPEFTSTPRNGHPLFKSFIEARDRGEPARRGATMHRAPDPTRCESQPEGRMKLCGFEAGLDKPLFLIAGPCVVESRNCILDTAGDAEGDLLPRWAFPSSSRRPTTRPTAVPASRSAGRAWRRAGDPRRSAPNSACRC